MHRILFASFALLVIPAGVRGAPASSQNEVVVSASRLATPAVGATYSVASIAAEQLADRQSVADALGSLATLYVQAPGGRSGVASVFLRGADPNFTTVLLDGVALNDSTNSRGGAVNVSELDTGMLDRIEVVAGPASSLYGSGALAGVIDLRVAAGTRDAEGVATATAGTRGDYSGAVRVTGPLPGGFGGSLAFTGSDDGDVSPGSRFRSWSLTTRIAALDASGPGRLLLRVSGTESAGFPDSSGGSRLATLRGLQEGKSSEVLVGMNGRVATQGAFTLDLAGSWLQRSDSTSSPGVAPSAFNSSGLPAAVDERSYRRGVLQALARFDHAEGNRVWNSAAGLELQREAGHDSGTLDFFGFILPSGFDAKRNIASAFVEGGFATAAFAFNAGVRADDVEDLGTHVTARAGLRYRIATTGFALRAATGRGFKSPSFYALGNPFVGNPQLRPERSASNEVGVDWSGGEGIEAAVTLFHGRYVDLIDFDPGPPPRLVNRSEVIAKGATATFALAVGERLTLNAQAQYASTVDDGGASLLNRPRWRATAGVTWVATNALSFELRNSYVSRRGDFSIPTGPHTLPAYLVVSMAGAWTVSPATRLRLVIDNVLDREYEEAVGFPSPRARARLSLTQRF